MAIVRHPKYKVLRSLTKKEEAQLKRGEEWAKKHPNARFTDACLSAEERRQLSRNP